MGWDPSLYLRFADERLRPGFDLLARVGEVPPGLVFDLGCGTGAHARALQARWPDRPVIAIDRSPEMLAKAAAEPSPVLWHAGDIAAFSAAPDGAALIFSNAALHWLDGHETLFPRLLREVIPGGVLAVQMPRNFAAPSHRLLAETAAEGAWAERLRPVLRPEPVAEPERYYDILAPLASGGIDLWETDYVHVLDGADPVLDWVRGTALRPLLDALPEPLAQEFQAAYGAKLRDAYPRRADGHTLLPFRRLFLVARAKG